MVKLSKHLTNSFELQIWFIATGLASVRGILGVADDLMAKPILFEVLGIDLAISLIFIGLCYGIFVGKVAQIPIWVSFAFILLLSINYSQFGGVGHGVEFNLIGLAVFLVLANKKRPLRQVLMFYIAALLALILEEHYFGWLSDTFFIKNGEVILDFSLILTVISLLILYFKQNLLRESRNLSTLKAQLTEKKAFIQEQNKKLNERKEFIKMANTRLQDEFMIQTNYLLKNNKSIEKFMHHITESLSNPINNIKTQAQNIKSTDSIMLMTKDSIEELHSVVHKLNHQLESHDNQKISGK